jgi:hypothetical protein
MPIRRFLWRSLTVATLVALALSFAAPRLARADDFLKSSPGDLAQSHAELEGQDNCTKCHTDGKALSNEKCLGCHDHEDQRQKIASGRGFHNSPKVVGKKCWDCHLDHKGRGYDLMGWSAVGGQDAFRDNHDNWTEFQLNGKHEKVECEKCHTRKNKQGLRLYMGESKVCGTCHKDDQPHRFERSEMMKCDRCHSEITWKPPKKVQDFDHNDAKQASFPLEGSHLDVACAKCHPKAEFNLKKDTTECRACHESSHKGHLYDKVSCAKCHSPKFGKLAKFEFDHDRNTKFKLDNAHRTKAKCYDCHPKGQANKPSKACEGCHRKDDKHGTRFAELGSPSPCGLCHGTRSFRDSAGEKFPHDTKTKFKLTGKHAVAGCRDCHRGSTPEQFERFDPKKVGCMGCHKHTKVHDRKYTDRECLDCHKNAGMIDVTAEARDAYHGEGSKFPLKFGHAKVPCEKCHANNVWKQPAECGAKCHQDSLHKGSLGDKCQRCHEPGIWKATRFDHNQDSDYKLKGLHKDATCEGCHPKRAYKPTPTSCGDSQCHLADDAHKRRLGRRCESCHKETGDNTFEHNAQADFKLRDSHLKVACKNCHPTLDFKPRPKDCFGCHPEPNVHKGQYGTKCDGCHNEVAWAQIKPIHDVGNFSLTASHDGIACVRCHRDSRPLAGTGPLCITCHREDDIHGNSLGPKCGECHSQWAFAPARFDHTQVGCDLKGQHRTLPCNDCHKAGNYAGLTGDCYGCHWDLGATRPTHVMNNWFTCGTCHNINVWAAQNTPGIPAHGSNSVCR